MSKFKFENMELELHFHKVVGRKRRYRYTLSIDNKIIARGNDYTPSQFLDNESMFTDCIEWLKSTKKHGSIEKVS